MRKALLFLILIFVSSILISCADKEQEIDEIIKYYNEEWVPINNSIKGKLEELTTEFIKLDAKKDKSEATELIQTEIIPLTEEMVTELENVEPENKTIKKMNNLQIEAEKFAIKSYKHIIKYYDGEITESELAKDKQKLDNMYEDVIEYQQKVLKKYNMKKSDEKIGNVSKWEKSAYK
ncbi:MAG TPA: hypothetical protein VK105_17995 [Virgibacillus sp.]|nr:hypothetical protein [Virgibacillus sp.]HLR68981.1 hypothetical protein [Virgibacillus sp.]